jgi:hypothetical protein
LKDFSFDTIVSVIDFVQNYTFEIHNEVQSMHYHNYQITILVYITWSWNSNPNPNDEDLQVLIKYHFYILNDN